MSLHDEVSTTCPNRLVPQLGTNACENNDLSDYPTQNARRPCFLSAAVRLLGFEYSYRLVFTLASSCLKAGMSVHATPLSVQVPQCFAIYNKSVNMQEPHILQTSL